MPIPSPSVARPPGRLARPGCAIEALDATRLAMMRFRSAMAFTGALLVAVAVVAVVGVLDVSWVLPTWARALGLVGLVALPLGVVAKAWFDHAGKFRQEEAAEEAEASLPELGQSLRTTLEYAKPLPGTMPASPSLVRALMRETDRRVDGLDLPALVPWGRWKLRTFGLLAALGVVVGLLASDPNYRIAVRRLFLLPEHYTTLAVEPGHATLKEGSPFTLKATLAGRPVPSAQWLRRPSGNGGPWTATPLGDADRKKPLVGLMDASLKDCRADFEYKVVAGEVESETYQVTITHPLNVKGFEAAIEPPAYTRLKPSTTKVPDFRVPEGSKVKLAIELDRAPTSARISWTPEGSKKAIDLPVAVEGTRLIATLPPLVKDARYEVSAKSADGMALEPSRHLIKVVPDAKPSIKFVKPAESLAALPTTEVPFKVVAADDHGVAKVGITYQIGDGPEISLYLGEPGEKPPTVEALATLYLEKHPLTFADSLGYRAFVEENREPTPRRVSTEVRYIDILPYKQAYQVVDGGPSNGSSATLEELILRQRRALNRALAHEDDRPVEGKVADRLVKEETEIAIVAAEFAVELASEFGPINPLDEAVQALEAATASLASQDLGVAIPQERAGLAALTRARQNLRKLLADSASAGKCQKIDRQQAQQSIRKPSADKSKEAEKAKLGQDIQKLAQAQMQFAEDIQSKASGGAKLDQPPEPQSDTPTKPSAAQPQQAAAKEVERLKELAEADEALTKLARQRLDDAASEIKKSAEAAHADQPDEAAKAAKAAAEALSELAEQVEGLKAHELADRLAKARDLARSTAQGGRDLTRKAESQGRDESLADEARLAGRAKTLADLLTRIEADAAEEEPTLAGAVGKAVAANPPGEVEQVLARAAASIASGQPEKTIPALGEASGKLDGLARDLAAARREFMQPKLQQLLAAEKQAAEARQALETAADEAGKAGAAKAVADLARAIEALKPGGGPLRDAANTLSQAAQSGAASGWTTPPKNPLKSGLFVPPLVYTEAVLGASKALQARIQELMLVDAVIERDGVVPPGYREKVEDYFRVLSEDLR